MISTGSEIRRRSREAVTHLGERFNGIEEVQHPELLHYLLYLHSQGLSENYIAGNRQYLVRYVSDLATLGNTLSPATAYKFLSKSNHLSINSRIRYAGYLKGFMAYLGMEFEVKMKRPHILPELVAEEDIERLREAVRAHKSYKASIPRDLLLIDTAILTGMRRAELARLTVGCLDLGRSRIKVTGKGRKDRVIPIGANLRDRLANFCSTKADDEIVFGLNRHSLGIKIKQWANKAGVPIHTHSFRHYFATTLVERGANLRVVQELLGHSSLQTTQVYLSVTANHLEDAIGLLDD